MVPITGENMTDKPLADMVTVAARIPASDLEILRRVREENQLRNVSEVIRIAIGAFCMIHKDADK